MLNEDRPDPLPSFPVGESLMLRYKAEQPLPPNTISRFIVRHNEEIKKEKEKYLVWRYGVVLKDGKGTMALVREEDRTISVSVKGKNKTAFISTLRDTLNDIFNSYKSKKPELQYRVQRFGEIPEVSEDISPLWLPDSKIYNHVIDNKPYYEDLTRQEISLQSIVQNFNISIGNLISGGTGNTLVHDQSSKTFNFSACNIGLQGNLNDLGLLLEESGQKKEAKEFKHVNHEQKSKRI